jgi:hypothetical protein
MKEERDSFWEKNLKVKMTWNIEPQKMLDTIIKIDRENGLSAPDDGASFYVGKSLEYIREVYEQYLGLDSLSDNDLIENEYYRLEIA